jgi:phospholipase C
MTAALDSVQTIVVLMLENRSFDHVLGHLRLPAFGNRRDVDGLENPDDNPAYVNYFEGREHSPFLLRDQRFISDMPHSRARVATQLAFANGRATMSGFAQAYAEHSGNTLAQPPVLGYLTPDDVPVSSFLARTFLTCDRWFAPLPTDTQPNRAMAFTGSTLIDGSEDGLIPHRGLVLDWLSKHQVPWRVYHSGLSFFLLFGPDAVENAVTGDFRSVRDLAGDVATEGDATWPSVIFVEPEYEDSPVHLFGSPNDNHPPLPMAPGESFLRSVYVALTANPARWAKTLFVVTYDEHGGFFDHVPPLPVRCVPPPGASFTDPFTTTGPRVPAVVASPLVEPASVFSRPLDHTSILQLLAEKFAGGSDRYSDEVTRRRDQGITSLSAVLEAAPAAATATAPPMPAAQALRSEVVLAAAEPVVSENQQAFLAAARALAASQRPEAVKRFPELLHLPQVNQP